MHDLAGIVYTYSTLHMIASSPNTEMSWPGPRPLGRGLLDGLVVLVIAGGRPSLGPTPASVGLVALTKGPACLLSAFLANLSAAQGINPDLSCVQRGLFARRFEGIIFHITPATPTHDLHSGSSRQITQKGISLRQA